MQKPRCNDQPLQTLTAGRQLIGHALRAGGDGGRLSEIDRWIGAPADRQHGLPPFAKTLHQRGAQTAGATENDRQARLFNGVLRRVHAPIVGANYHQGITQGLLDMASSFDFDLFVIGGGSGGVRAARVAAIVFFAVLPRRGEDVFHSLKRGEDSWNTRHIGSWRIARM